MTNWLVRSLVLRKVDRPWLARCEMTAAAIASTSAIIDCHGRVLRLTRSTCADRSICLPFCTRDSSLRDCPPNAIRQEARAAGLPGTTGGLAWKGSKRWGPGRCGPVPRRLRDQGVHLMRAGPTGNLSLPPMPADMPAAEVYQAATAVTTPT